MTKTHILLIENNEEKLDFFSDALEESNLEFTCSRARNIRQAAKILKNLLPDIVFVGLNLPKISGVEFLKKIKKMECFKSTPVVLYSTIKNQSDEDVAENCVSDYILLPDNIFTMASILKNFFSGIKEVSCSENIELNFYD